MGAVPERRISTPDRSRGKPWIPPTKTNGNAGITQDLARDHRAKGAGMVPILVEPGYRFPRLNDMAAVAVLAIVGLIVAELMQSSSLAWQKFGLHFFFNSAWDPVAGDFGALPFIFGTVVSSIIALVIAVPLAIAVAVFTTEMCPKPPAQTDFFRHRTAGSYSQRDLWALGNVHPGADFPGLRRPVLA